MKSHIPWGICGDPGLRSSRVIMINAEGSVGTAPPCKISSFYLKISLGMLKIVASSPYSFISALSPDLPGVRRAESSVYPAKHYF